jgi:hypothetical protein
MEIKDAQVCIVLSCNHSGCHFANSFCGTTTLRRTIGSTFRADVYHCRSGWDWNARLPYTGNAVADGEQLPARSRRRGAPTTPCRDVLEPATPPPSHSLAKPPARSRRGVPGGASGLINPVAFPSVRRKRSGAGSRATWFANSASHRNARRG